MKKIVIFNFPNQPGVKFKKHIGLKDIPSKYRSNLKKLKAINYEKGFIYRHLDPKQYDINHNDFDAIFENSLHLEVAVTPEKLKQILDNPSQYLHCKLTKHDRVKVLILDLSDGLFKDWVSASYPNTLDVHTAYEKQTKAKTENYTI